MDVIPVEDLAEEGGPYFTFGADSVGMWIFLVLSVILFLLLIVRTIRLENHLHGHSLTEEHMAASPFTPPAPAE